MQFIETPLKNAFEIQLKPIEDERGAFIRSWCHNVFEDLGLENHWVQSNISFNHVKGTLRGMHYQIVPYAEVKLVRCSRGAIYDVIIDVRPESPTYLQWFSIELTAENYKTLYIPQGFAHGYQTLQDNTEVTYQVSAFYHPDSARGILWNDPLLNIKWPVEPSCISLRDQQWPLLPLGHN